MFKRSTKGLKTKRGKGQKVGHIWVSQGDTVDGGRWEEGQWSKNIQKKKTANIKKRCCRDEGTRKWGQKGKRERLDFLLSRGLKKKAASKAANQSLIETGREG